MQGGASIPQHSWPSNFHATVIDVDSGELVLLGPDHGIPLEEGVAASGAPAGIIEPFHIGDRWFMDGGMRSGTNADAAMAFEPGAVLVVAVTDHTIPLVGRLMGACIEREVAALSAAGKRVHVMTPNAEDNAAMTPNRLDVTRVPGAIQAGLARGRQLARSPELLSLTQT